MRTERTMAFARLHGVLDRYGIPATAKVRSTAKALEKNVGNMTSEQISAVATLIQGTVEARDLVIKLAISKAIDEAK